MKIIVENIIAVADFEGYINLLHISPTDGEKKWYTYVLTEVPLDMIVYGVLARWISTYCNEPIESIVADLKGLTVREVKLIGDDTE